MKLVNGKTGLAFRLGVIVAALLLGQQAMAVGTRAGTDISNTANVDYQVGGVVQATLSDTVNFVVDRRVDFTLVPVSTPDLELVNPGEQDAWVDFTLTNTSNSNLDFALALAQMSGSSVDGQGNDNADMDNIEWAVVTAGDPTPTQGGAQFVDDLEADASVRIRVWGDAALTLLDGEIAGLELTATARLGGSAGLGGVLAYGVANDDTTVQNVDPDAADGVRVSNDGFEVESAQISVAKIYNVVGNDLGSGLPIPGATVEYTITITNAGTAVATNVVITDTLDDDLTFLADQFGGGADMTINGAGCTEDAPDSDGCVRAGQDLTFDVASIAGGGGSLVIVYHVTINNPAATP